MTDTPSVRPPRNASYPGFLRIRRGLKDKVMGSILDTQELLSSTFASMGYSEPAEIITEVVMTEALFRMDITFATEDVICFLDMCVNPDTNEVHNYDVYRSVEYVDAQPRSLNDAQPRSLNDHTPTDYPINSRPRSLNDHTPTDSPSNSRPRSLNDHTPTDSPSNSRPRTPPDNSMRTPNEVHRPISVSAQRQRSMSMLESESRPAQLTPASLLQMRTSVESPYAQTRQHITSPEQPVSSAISSMYKKLVGSAVASEKLKPEHDLEDFLGESYIDNTNANRLSSNALDVLALYIKGQKLLYTEAKTYCEQQLNFLMLPAIFISCVGSIFSFLSGRYQNGEIIIASLNGFNAFLLALISYLKLDAKAQAHKTSAYKFDKLESMCEFNSGKFMFFDTTQLDIMDVVKQIEKDVKEVKETNQFILPESIRYEFNFTYTTNVFLLVKKIQATEMAETNNLANLVRQINAGCDRYNSLDPLIQEAKDLQREIDCKIKKQNKCLNVILECREQYFNLDTGFTNEINYHISRSNRWFIFRLLCCDWLKS